MRGYYDTDLLRHGLIIGTDAPTTPWSGGYGLGVETLHLSLAANERYVPHVATSIHSFLANRGQLALHVHFLHIRGFDEACLRPLRETVEDAGGRVSFYPIGRERVAGLPSAPPFSIEMWLRVFLPDVLPGLDRVLYVDADTIACDSVEPLWRTDLGDDYLGAVTNVFQLNHLQRPAELGLAGPEVYFNSGVLLLNLSAMRRDDCSRALIELARERRESLEWPDQDALNLVLGERRLPLHPRWNCMNSTLTFPQSRHVYGRRAVNEARRSPGIRHFEGPADNKPWHREYDGEAGAVYWNYRRATPWPAYELEGAGPAAEERSRTRTPIDRACSWFRARRG